MSLSRQSASMPYQSLILSRNLIDQAILHFGRIDILVLNAGVSSHFLFEDNEDLSVFKKMIDINFFGYLYPTK